MADAQDDNPPVDPIKAIVEKVATRGRPDDQPYRVKPRPRKPRKPTVPGMPKKGGYRDHPNVIKALEEHRHKTMFGHGQRTCAREDCRQIAVTGVPFCRHHGGMGELNARRRMDPDYKPRRLTLFRRELRNALEHQTIPLELLRQPVFLRVLTVATSKLEPADGDWRSAVRRWKNANRLVLEFMQAWVFLNETGNTSLWVKAANKANLMGI